MTYGMRTGSPATEDGGINVHYFRTIVFSSVFAGIIAGAAVTGAQLVSTAPLILKAEVFEKAASSHHEEEETSTAQTTALAPEHVHEHQQDAWEPSDGVERTSFTLAANILTAIGWAMLLSGLMMARGKPVGLRDGLLWGAAGFACVMLAPMAGLPPELPGTPAAPLEARQFWWIVTAVLTGAGIALACFRRKPWAFVVALGLIASPHIVGAPLFTGGETPLAPAELEHQFVIAAVLTSLLSWLLIGPLSGFFLRRFQQEA
jgi:cobalt transporter subunit CbtA